MDFYDALDGVELPISNDWRKRVRLARDDKGWTDKQLAHEAGTTPATVSNVLKKSKTSNKVAAISRALQIAVPFAPVEDTRELTWLGMGKALREADPREFDRTIESLARKLEKPT